MKLELTQLESEWLYAILNDCKCVSPVKDASSKYVIAQTIKQKMEAKK